MEEALALLKNSPEGTQLFTEMTRSMLLDYALTLSTDSYIDYETGQCRFDSPSFIQLLELAKTFPEEIDYELLYRDGNWEEYYRDYETQYREDRTLLMNLHIYDFNYMRTLEMITFGEPFTFIGFPCDNDSGSAIVANQQYAMSAKSKNQEGVWQFLREFLTDDYQNKIEYELPLKISALEAYGQKSMIPNTYKDENGNDVEYPNTYWFQEEEIDIGYPTQENVDFMINFIKSVETLYRTDSSLMEIIEEEAGAFFAGQKTAQDVANIIQNRAQIYINESR